MNNNKLYKILVIIGVLIIPFMYSFFYLKAYWDPYGKGNIDNIPVAVVNSDNGNKGDELIDSIKKSNKLKLSTVSYMNAYDGLNDGDYYAVISIPKDFSESFDSINSKKRKHASITYSPNQKSNYLASQIINSVVGAVEKNLDNKINSSIIDSLSNNLLEVPTNLDKISNGFSQLKDGTLKLKNGSVELSNGVSQLSNGSDLVESGSKKLENGVSKVSNGTESLKTNYKDFDDGIKNLSNGLGELNSASSQFDSLTSGINGVDTSISTLLGYSDSSLSDVSDYVAASGNIASKVGEVLSICQSINFNGINMTVNENIQLKKICDELGSSSNITNLGVINDDISYNTDLNKNVSNIVLKETTINTYLNGLSTKVHLLNGTASKKINFLKTNISKLNDGGIMLKTNSSKINEGINTLNDGAFELLNGAHELSQGISTLSNGSKKLGVGADSLLNGIQTLDSSVGSASHEMDENLSNTKSDLELLNGLKDYSEEPVKVKNKIKNEVPSYGTAFGPLFISIALWVGCLMLYVVLYYDRDSKFGILDRDSNKYVLRTCFYHILATLSGIVLGLTLQILLDFSINNVLLYYFVIILTANTFLGIIEFLIVNFNDVGKFLALIILVLQLAASGGTFPIETVSKCFRWLNSCLPMTYTIKLIKEPLISVESKVLTHNLLIVSVICIIFFIINIVSGIIREKNIKR